MRELEMRAVLRAVCDELDRARRAGRGALLGSAIGIAALALSACVEVPQPAGADASVDRSVAAEKNVSVDLAAKKDGYVDLPHMVPMYGAVGCNYISPRRR